MVGQALRSRATTRGLRPFDPARDVGQVSELLRQVFAAELKPDEMRMLRQMGALQYIAPLLWAANTFSTAFRASFGGFVWVEDGRVVGNASLTSADEDGRYWVISNVAVAPEYRRRGIATELMQAAIDVARERGGRAVTLRVRADNRAAKSLYEKLRFELLDSTAYLWLERARPVPEVDAGRYRLQPWGRSGGRKAHELALSTVPARLQRMRPLCREQFDVPPQHPILVWLLGLAWGRMVRGWAIEEQDRYRATLIVEVGVWRGEHRMRLLVHPEVRGQVEGLMVSHALNFVSGQRARSVEAEVPADHREAIAVLQRQGFVIHRVLDLMGLELVKPVTIKVRSRNTHTD